MPISSLSMALRSKLSKAVDKEKETRLLLDAATKEHLAAIDRLEGIEDCAKEVQALAIACQTSCQAKISSIVNRCLVEIDPDTKYTFSLVFEEKRNQTEARCVLRDGSGNEYSPDQVGGGIRDQLAMALRLACLLLMRPAPDRVLVLDEPFRFLSKEYRGPMLSMLSTLCTELGVQVIMVTHFQEHMQGNVIEI